MCAQSVLLLRNLQFSQLRSGIGAVVAGLHLFVNVFDFSIVANDEGPSFRNLATLINNTISFGNFPAGVAQNWIVQLQLFRKFRIVFYAVTTRGEIGNFEFANRFAVRTERQTLLRSATGKRFRKPRNHDSLFVFEIRKPVCLPITAC